VFLQIKTKALKTGVYHTFQFDKAITKVIANGDKDMFRPRRKRAFYEWTGLSNEEIINIANDALQEYPEASNTYGAEGCLDVMGFLFPVVVSEDSTHSEIYLGIYDNSTWRSEILHAIERVREQYRDNGYDDDEVEMEDVCDEYNDAFFEDCVCDYYMCISPDISDEMPNREAERVIRERITKALDSIYKESKRQLMDILRKENIL
jgi:hypothetical protein